MADSNGPNPSYDPSQIYQLTGPLIVGYQLNWALYGVLSIQVYHYSHNSAKDKRFIRCLVYGLYVIETLQTILTSHDTFNQFVYGWGDPQKLAGLYLAWLDLPILSGLTSAIIQCFYAWRIFTLSRSRVLPICISLVAMMQGSAAIAEGIEALILSDIPHLQDNTYKTTIVWLGGTAICDIMICSAMVYVLVKGRNGFSRTDTMLNKLIILIIETGMATATLATIELILFLRFKHNFYHVAPALVLSKLYSNSLLVLLNNRSRLRSGGRKILNSSDTMSYEQSPNNTKSNAIQVSIEQNVLADDIEMVGVGKQRSTRQFEKPSSVSITPDV